MAQKKVVLITGASSGIGLMTAEFLAQNGFKVYGMAINDFYSTTFTYIKGDVTKEESIKEVLKEIWQKEKRLDAVINNAGFGISGAVEHTLDSSVFNIFNVNVLGLMKVCKNAIPYLRDNGEGKIINIGSVASDLPIAFQSYYSATKASVKSFSLALREEVKPFDIKVTCVMPGDAKTGFTANRKKNLVETDVNYGLRIKNSVARMEKDEENGMDPICISKTILKVLNSKNPKPIKVVGFKYKVFCVLNKILPQRLVSFILGKMYGCN